MENSDLFNDWKNKIESISISKLIDSLRIIELNISNICDLKCPFCPQGNGWKNFNKKFIDLNAINLINKYLLDINYSGYICIAGHGEPTLHPQIIDILKILKNFKIVLVTNGVNLTEELINEITKYCLIKVSVHVWKDIDKYRYKFRNSNAIFRNHDMLNPNMNLYNRAGNIDSRNDKISHKCNYLFYKIMIDIDGKYKRCEADWNSITKNKYSIYNCTIDDYFCNKLNKIRSLMLINRQLCGLCKKCNINGELIGNKFVDYYINEKR